MVYFCDQNLKIVYLGELSKMKFLRRQGDGLIVWKTTLDLHIKEYINDVIAKNNLHSNS